MDPDEKHPTGDFDADLADELASDWILDEWGAEDLLGQDIDLESTTEWGSI